jgi:hypothetical protein
MFLKISFNKWHGILAIIAVALVFVPCWFFFSYLLFPVIGIAGTFLFFLVMGIMVAHHLQSWNEAKQAIDPKLEEKYTNWENFVDNSKDDWKWFWRGILISWIIPFIFILVSLK